MGFSSLARRLNDKFYIWNGIYLFGYFICQVFGFFEDEKQTFSFDTLVYKMKSSGSIMFTMIALAILKYLRSCSVEQFLRTYFILTKVTIFGRSLFVDPTYSLLHLIVFTILYLFAEQPPYLGKSDAITPIRNADQFFQAVTKYSKRSSKRDESILTYKKTNMQFVEFYRDNEQLSNDTRGLWVGFAEKYQTQRMKFYSVNVNKVKGIAEEYDIDVKPESAEFPTVILFEEGELKLRFPVDDGNTYLGKQLKAFRRKAFEKYFGFHNRWFDTKDEKLEEKAIQADTKSKKND